MASRPLVLDVSRLIWRLWAGRFPTGIDRVCLAYLAHYRARACAMVQWGRWRKILPAAQSDALFTLLSESGSHFRRRLPPLLARAIWTPSPDVRGKIYINVGHTGLDATGFPQWLARKGLRPIFMVHDLIPITHPHFCRPGEAARHSQRMRNLLAAADGVIANSADTLGQLQHFATAQAIPMPANSLVAWLGLDRPMPTPRGPIKVPHQAAPYFLCIGTIEARKNHLMLLRLWQRLIVELGDATPQLILVGQRGWEADDVFALLDGDVALRRHVTELGRCSDITLAGLFDQARAALMPSFAEGFGLPVVEALQRGCPIIASDLDVFREIAGNIPLLLPPDDLEAWHKAVLSYRYDSTDWQRQKEALAGYTPQSWADHFDKVDAWIVRLSGQSRWANSSGLENAINPGR